MSTHLQWSPIYLFFIQETIIVFCVFILFITYFFNYLREVFTNTLSTHSAYLTELALTKDLLNEGKPLAASELSKNGRYEDNLN